MKLTKEINQHVVVWHDVAGCIHTTLFLFCFRKWNKTQKPHKKSFRIYTTFRRKFIQYENEICKFIRMRSGILLCLFIRLISRWFSKCNGVSVNKYRRFMVIVYIITYVLRVTDWEELCLIQYHICYSMVGKGNDKSAFSIKYCKLDWKLYYAYT